MDRYPTSLWHCSLRVGSRLKMLLGALTLTPLALAALLAVPAFADGDGTTIYKYIDSNGNIVFTDHPTKGAEKIHVNPPPPIPLSPIEMPGDKKAGDGGKSAPQPQERQQPPQAAPQPSVPQMQMRQPAPAASNESASPDNGIHANAGAETRSPPAPKPAPAPAEAQPAPVAPQSTEQRPTASPYQYLRITSPRPGLQIPKPGGTIIVQLDLSPALNAAVGDRYRIIIDGTTMVDDSTSARHMISGLKPGPHTLIAMVIRQQSNQARNLIESAPLQFELAGAPDEGNKPSDNAH